MERRHGTCSATNQNRHAVVLGQDLATRPDALDEWRSDEDSMKRLVERFDSQIGFEARKLSAVAISADGEVDAAETPLVIATIEHISGAQDHSSARPEHRQASGETRLQVVEQVVRREQVRHRGALSSREHERVNGSKLFCRPNQRSRDTEFEESFSMRRKRTLQCQDADDQIGVRSGHQPRSA